MVRNSFSVQINKICGRQITQDTSKSDAMKKIMILVFITVAAKTVVAQDYSADVKSTDTIVAALYNVILVEPNTPRDWARFRNLFKPEARLIPTRKNEAGDRKSTRLNSSH